MGAMHGAGGGGNAMRQFRWPKKEQPQLMDPTRERDRGRILRLFRPYRRRLTIVVVLVMFAAGISMLNPFLVQAAHRRGPRQGQQHGARPRRCSG